MAGKVKAPFTKFLEGLSRDTKSEDAFPFKRGDILSVDFPFSNGRDSKVRPVVFWGMKQIHGHHLMILTYITSKEKEYARNRGVEYAIAPENIKETLMLNGHSYVRCDYTVALPIDHLIRPDPIGHVKQLDLDIIQMITDDCLRRIDIVDRYKTKDEYSYIELDR